MEFRIKDCQLQADNDGSLKVGGYINVTERESEMLYNKKNGKWFKEIMKKGVFKRAIERAGMNIPLLFEHDWNKQLASLEEGSLELREDNIGLRFDAVINDESIYQQVKAGIINSCSFGFRALAEEVESINSRLEKRFVSAIELLAENLEADDEEKVEEVVEEETEETEAEDEVEDEKADDEDEADKRFNEVTVPVEVEPEIEKVNIKELVEELIEAKLAEIKEAEVKEEKVEDTEEKTEAGDEPKEDEKAEIDEEVEEDKRFNELDVSVIEVSAIEAKPEIDNDYIKKLVDELIEVKLAEIKNAEVIEEEVNQELQLAKDFHEEVEKELEAQTMAHSAEVLRLRLELLKLKEVKEGI